MNKRSFLEQRMSSGREFDRTRRSVQRLAYMVFLMTWIALLTTIAALGFGLYTLIMKPEAVHEWWMRLMGGMG